MRNRASKQAFRAQGAGGGGWPAIARGELTTSTKSQVLPTGDGEGVDGDRGCINMFSYN